MNQGRDPAVAVPHFPGPQAYQAQVFDEETLVILLTLFFLAAGILYSTLEVSEFYLKELKSFRTRIPEQCFAGFLHSISLCMSEMVRLKCLCHVNGRETGPASLEGCA